jgi:Ca2+-binding EF-hand superfamily protein
MLKGTIGYVDEYGPNDFKAMFRRYDQDNSGFLDFREFICCISVLLRGNLRDRLAMTAETIQN